MESSKKLIESDVQEIDLKGLRLGKVMPGTVLKNDYKVGKQIGSGA